MSKFSQLAKGLYYKLTAYMPRRMPQTSDEYMKFKEIMMKYYGVEDNPAAMATVASHLGSIPAWSMKVQYGVLANTAKRLVVNKLAHEHKMFEIAKHEDKLKQAELKLVKDETPKEELTGKETSGQTITNR